MNNTKTIVLADILSREENNLDLIRLIASITVIFGHSFAIFKTGGHLEPVTQLLKYNFSGTIAVGIFFFISGILIPRSFNNSHSILQFIAMRLARIYPGALVCLFLCVFFLGPAVTTLSLQEYFLSPKTYCYIRDNWSFTYIFSYWYPRCENLPGVFIDNRMSGGVNGSLWTLYPEVACYFYVLILGCIGLMRSRKRIMTCIFSLLILHYYFPNYFIHFTDYYDTLRVGLFFMCGTAAYAYKDSLVLEWKYAFFLFTAALLLHETPLEQLAAYLFIFYFVLMLAQAKRINKLKPKGDYSFGIYIYGFPIQQTLYYYYTEITAYPSNLICIPIAVLMGILSWYLIEKPSIKWAKKVFV